MTYQLRLDYATFCFQRGEMSAQKVQDVLCGGDVSWRKCGLYDGSPVISPLGLRYQHNCGYSERPHKLQVSGVGCEHFALTLPDLREAAENHFSRLDFAFDVVMSRRDWKVFLGNCFIDSMDSERQRKRYRLAGDGEAMTVYIGSRVSSKFFRIYNKTLEDPKYTFEDALDPNNTDVDVDDEHCVIRYEVELHRQRQVHHDRTVEFDPSSAFDWYYSPDPADHDRLHDEIKRLWLSFGNDILLPEGFENAEFVDRVSKNKNFVRNLSHDEKLENVQAVLHDYPHSFEKSLQYVTERFGAYIPYILADESYRRQAFQACELKFGFCPEYYFETSKPSGWNDLDDECDLDPEIPWAWVEASAADQDVIDESFERRYKNQWSL